MSGRQKTYIDLAIIAALGFLPLLWFREGYTALAGFDFSVYLNPVDTLVKSQYLWSDKMAGGYDISHEISSMPYYLLFSLPVLLGAGLYAAEKFVFVVIFSLQGFSMYYMLKSLFRGHRSVRTMALVGAFFYAVSYPVMAHFGRGNLMALLTYGLLPFLLGLLYSGFMVQARRYRYVLYIALLTFPIAATKGHPADFVVLVGVAVFFVLFHLLFGAKENRGHILGFSALVLAASIVVNLWWLVPNLVYLMDFGLSAGEMVREGFYNLDVLDYYSRGTSFINVFRNERLDLWFDIPGDWLLNTQLYQSTLFIAIGLLLPLLASFALLKRQTNANVAFFGIVAVAAAFLCKGSHEPFGGLYEWLYLNVPGFLFFRAPYRVFSSLFTFAIVPLIAVAVGGFMRLLRAEGSAAGSRHPGWDRVLAVSTGSLVNLTVVLVLLTLMFTGSVYAWPVFSGSHLRELGTKREPGVFHSIPVGYYEAESWLAERPPSKVYYPYQVYDSNTVWGYNGPDPSFEIITSPKVVSRPGGTVYVRYQRPIESLNRVFWGWRYGELGKALGVYNIGHVLLHDDYSSWVLPEKGFNGYATALLEEKGFGLGIDTGPLRLYENGSTLPRIFTSERAYLLAGDEAAFPALSLAGYLDAPFMLMSRDIDGPKELLRRLKAVDGVVFHNANAADLVAASYERAAPVRIGKETLSFTAASSEAHYLFVKGAKKSSEHELDGIAWRYSGAFELHKGPNTLTLPEGLERPEDNTDAPKGVMVPAKEFDEAIKAVNGRLGAAGFEVAYLFDFVVPDIRWRVDTAGGDKFSVQYIVPAPLRATALSKGANGNGESRLGAKSAGVCGQVNSTTFYLNGRPVPLRECDRWYGTGVSAGTRTIGLRKGAYMDAIVLVRKNAIKPVPGKPAFQRLNPAKYTVSLDAKEKTMLVFSESFNKGWSLYMNGKRYEAVKVNGYANGFMIDAPELEAGKKAETYEVTLRYGPQRFYDYSRAVSIAGITGLMVLGGRRAGKGAK